MAPRVILAVNAGSSSLKVSLFQSAEDSQQPKLLATASVSGIGSSSPKLSFQDSKKKVDTKDHASAFDLILDQVRSAQVADPDSITHICHRVVHGGDYTEPVAISNESFHHIEQLTDLAPLHNGSALAVIQSAIKRLPNAQSLAFFDSAFHRSIPRHISSYAIDQKIALERGLKKYGFHGLSYSYILRTVAQYLRRPSSSLNLIVMHLGSGASVCAIKEGKSLDTSMGLTPVSGLPGGTRSGAIDPSLIFHYTNTAGRISHDPKVAANIQVTEAEEILNKKSGWNALTGTSDFGEVTAAREKDDNCALAFNLFADRILDFVGAYHVKLGGKVDALVFSGGIGEKSAELREEVGRRVQCLGYQSVRADKNAAVDSSQESVVDIGTGSGDHGRVLVCKTDEQYEMALQCMSNS